MPRARTTTRRLATAGTLTALALLTTGAVALLAPLPTTPVTPPPDDATPTQVVHTYTQALAGHDCTTAAALRTHPDDATWCDALATLTDIHIGTPVPEDPALSGHAPHQQVVHVPVTLTPTWRPLRDDSSLDEAPTTWGYRLVRDTPHTPWRIADEGVA
ncbi:hypothetical protein [Cellulosimicrobium marinum]|uniref:hypothetical protein n=1 Tax=Cellulosimicrobium marinum TaxID=1638992 RepID=UPI001E2E3920|nr:hypothetical protein [Cellulosimicrobium marinum]MCB7137523.1 hypothetical protein [Cellulosimicrobium marinum]